MITEPATTSPNSPRKLPTNPSTKTTGRKTAATEIVALVAAKAISRVPTLAASLELFPPARWRSIFSSTTMASSITTPTARVIPRSVMVFSVNPLIHTNPKVATSETGIASAMINVGRDLRRKMKTVKTASAAPKTNANLVSATASRTPLEKSMKPSGSPILISGGRIFSISSRRDITSSTIPTVLPPDCFRIPIPTEISPLYRMMVSTSSEPSSTRATSRR